jgi:hypothetical protein
LRYATTYNLSGIGMRPLRPLDRIFQLGLLPDRRSQRPAEHEQKG